jgi:tight adherence protein C
VIFMDFFITSLLGLTVTALVIGIVYTAKRERIAVLGRLGELNRQEEKPKLPADLSRPLKERLQSINQNFISRLTGRIPRNKKMVYEQKLIAAGCPGNMTVETFLVCKYLVLIVFIILGVLLHNLGYFLLFLLLGLFLPDFYLKSEERKRKDLMLKSLPDVLDLLSVSVEAGLSFDAALQKVVDKTSGPLTDEFDKTLQELNLGKVRREALRDMAERTGINEVSTFLGSIIQADQLGVSITNVLRLQSRQVRNNRRMMAEELAQKAPIKILLPLLLFIFPTILIVLLGPAVIQLMDTL